MRISLAVLDMTLVGGIERVAANMANMFAAHGDDVVIRSFFRTNDAPFYDIDRRVKIVYLSDKEFRPGSKLSMLGRYRIMARQSRRALDADDSDVVISLFTNISIILSLFGRGKVPVIAAEHGQYYAHGILVRTLRRITYRKIAAVVSIASTDAAIYAKLFGGRSRCIPNSIDRIPDRKSPCSGKRMIAVGRLVREKGFDRLVEMASGFLGDDRSGWRLDIFGDGYEREHLESRVRERRMDERIAVRQFEKDIERELGESSIYLCSSRTESFGMAILEAMACGLPVVSFDCPTGPRDIIENGVSGFLVTPGDERKFSEQVRILMKDETLRRETGSRARERAKRYLPDAVYETWKTLIGEIK